MDAYNLFQEDAIVASDHLPVVNDFYLDNVTGFKNIGINSSAGLLLQQNEPNPFSQKTTIKYHLQQNSMVDLSIFNIMGLKVANLVHEGQNAGNYAFEFDVAHLNEGIYFIKLKAGEYNSTKKMMILR